MALFLFPLLMHINKNSNKKKCVFATYVFQDIFLCLPVYAALGLT